MHMPVNAAVRAIVCSPGKAAPLGVLCLRIGASIFLYQVRRHSPTKRIQYNCHGAGESRFNGVCILTLQKKEKLSAVLYRLIERTVSRWRRENRRFQFIASIDASESRIWTDRHHVTTVTRWIGSKSELGYEEIDTASRGFKEGILHRTYSGCGCMKNLVVGILSYLISKTISNDHATVLFIVCVVFYPFQFKESRFSLYATSPNSCVSSSSWSSTFDESVRHTVEEF